MAKAVFDEMFINGGDPNKISEDKGLSQINDTESIQNVVSEILLENPSAVEDYLDGKDYAVIFLLSLIHISEPTRRTPI